MKAFTIVLPFPSMKTLDDRRRQLSAGEFEFSHHAFKRAVERNISTVNIQEAGA